jgi:N12 class adenine-specific DNA methylase
LLVSLDQRGIVDLPFIATLYGVPVRQIIAELGDLIYQDPDTRVWHTADVYLSGNVRAKLVAAERAGSAYARNVEALRAVQPEDVLPGRDRRPPGCALDTGKRYPGLRGVAVQRPA